jgi:predicted DNA-binding transcriptional regulator AlpA
METINPEVTGRRVPRSTRKRGLLRLAAMMARYGVSGKTIDRWEESGKISKSIRIGRFRYWREEELDELDQSRTA